MNGAVKREQAARRTCCLTTRTPEPPQAEHVWMSLSEAAPEPRQWSHSICFLILNCEDKKKKVQSIMVKINKQTLTSMWEPSYLRNRGQGDNRLLGMRIDIHVF